MESEVIRNETREPSCNCKTNRTYIYLLTFTIFLILFSEIFLSLFVYALRTEISTESKSYEDKYSLVLKELKELKAIIEKNKEKTDDTFEEDIPEQTENIRKTRQAYRTYGSQRISSSAFQDDYPKIEGPSSIFYDHPSSIGAPGRPGSPGRPGRPGSPGLPGHIGPPGRPGQPGIPGGVSSSGNCDIHCSPGVPGPRGFDGLPGPRGPPGFPGEPCDCDYEMDTGYPSHFMNGNRRPSSRCSCKGDPGPKGEPGLDGEPGMNGEPGLNGEAGVKGEPGLKGDAGLEGRPGPIGEPGMKGEAGPKGDAGPKGEAGPKGDAGLRGADGPKGEKGERAVLVTARKDETPNSKGDDGGPETKVDKKEKVIKGRSGTGFVPLTKR